MRKLTNFFVFFCAAILFGNYVGANECADTWTAADTIAAMDISVKGSSATNYDLLYIYDEGGANGRVVWQHVTGGLLFRSLQGKRVTICPNRTAWVVDSNGVIYRGDVVRDEWDTIDGPFATDIGCGGHYTGSGEVYITGAIDTIYGGKIYRYNQPDSRWDEISGLAVRVDVDDKGKPWVVNNQGMVWKLENRGWVRKISYWNGNTVLNNFEATDIGVDCSDFQGGMGPNDLPVAINYSGDAYQLETNDVWMRCTSDYMDFIAVDRFMNYIWAVNADGQIYYTTSNN